MARRKKKDNYYSNFLNDKSEYGVYVKGAFIGGIIGAVSSILLKKKVIWWTLIGALGGGYLAHEITKGGESSIESKPLKKTFKKKIKTTDTKKESETNDNDIPE